ncbi:MAG: hypothetical protein ACRDNF_22430 [Streptosporangiaceae bacterium]
MNASAAAVWNSPAARIRAIAAGLAAAGLAATTNGNNLTGLDVTATSQPPGRARAEIMLDEDGYAEILWFTNPAAPAEEVTAVVARILAAITERPQPWRQHLRTGNTEPPRRLSSKPEMRRRLRSAII